jgi:hypothetical protein
VDLTADRACHAYASANKAFDHSIRLILPYFCSQKQFDGLQYIKDRFAFRLSKNQYSYAFGSLSA